jgi:hypothetical protein
MLRCSFCNYITDRKFNLQRHNNNKHYEILEKQQLLENEQKVNPNEQKVNPNEQKVNPNEQKVNPNTLYCNKCNKLYKTLKHLSNHEKKCNKVYPQTYHRRISNKSRTRKNKIWLQS